MKTATQWLNEYGESHQNPTNIAIHKICVPAIMFSVLGFLWVLKVPGTHGFINAATLVSIAAVMFYARLSFSLSIGMFAEAGLMLAALWILEAVFSAPVVLMSISIFVVAWILQFVGHKIEGKKPSFFQDLIFLMIGPLWTLSFVYKKLGIKI